MKLCWSLIMVTGVVLTMSLSAAESDLWEEDDKEVLVRMVRGTKERASASPGSCRYAKGPWSECDAKTNVKTRSLTLKKGDKTCEQSKTIQKKCKKACRYEKGTFTPCENSTMVRQDTLKPNSDSSCQPIRRITKGCKSENNTKKSPKGDRANKKSGSKQ